MQLLVAFCLLLASSGVLAAPVDIACWWEPHRSRIAEDDTGLFYAKPSEALRLRVDADRDVVDFPESDSIDKILLPNRSMYSSANSLEITFVQPNWRYIKGKRSVLRLTIDRYTLESTLLLALPSPTGELQSKWIRLGKCVTRQI